mgnify:CR=1 FL=1
MIDISVSNLVKEFEVGKRILDGLSFQVDQGERVGLLGRNGAGKTTVFRLLTGQLEPDEGEVMVAPGKGVGLISQIPIYPAGYTVEDVLLTAFDKLHAMEREMSELTARMEHDPDPALLRRYGVLSAAFEAGEAMIRPPDSIRCAAAWRFPGKCGSSSFPPCPGEKRPG